MSFGLIFLFSVSLQSGISVHAYNRIFYVIKKILITTIATLSLFYMFQILKNEKIVSIQTSAKISHIKTPGIGLRADAQELEALPVISPVLSKNKSSFLTFNKMGFDILFNEMTWVAKDFIDFCQLHQNEYVLDVGAGYGFLSHRALSKGVNVISNDIDARHLLYIRNESKSHDKISKLFLNINSFPYLDIPENFLKAVILHRVMHFMSGEEIDLGLKNIRRWLKVGGKVYIVVMCAEHIVFRDQVMPEFEQRKKDGDPWPGMYLDVNKHLPDQVYVLPDKLHVMDQEILKKALERHGFEIEKMDYISMRKFGSEKKRDKKESVGVVAVKKK